MNNVLSRGSKIYLDVENTVESAVNQYLDCRDGIVKMIEYAADSGYGSPSRLFLCIDSKHETVALIRQHRTIRMGGWIEEATYFDSDSFEFLECLITGNPNRFGKEVHILRDYNTEREL